MHLWDWTGLDRGFRLYGDRDMQCTNNNIKIELLTFSINSPSFLRKVKSSYKCAVFAFGELILPYASDMMLEEEEGGEETQVFLLLSHHSYHNGRPRRRRQATDPSPLLLSSPSS